MLLQLFCSHIWSSKSKKTHKWINSRVMVGTEMWFRPVITHAPVSETIEILACNKCGKVKKMIY